MTRTFGRLFGYRLAELQFVVLTIMSLYAALSVWWLPPLAELGLAAGPRVVADLGLNGLRLASAGLAVAAGHGALGPPLRRGEADFFYTLPGAPTVWPLARLTASVVASWIAATAGVGVWTTISTVLGAPLPAGLGAWFATLLAECAVITALAAAAGLWLRGPAGPSLAVTVCAVGHLSLFLEDIPWSEAPFARSLSVVLPQLWRLDLLPSVLANQTPGSLDLAARLAYGGLWAGGVGAAAWLTARPPARSEGTPWSR